jgi:subtilisin family serine protease
MLKKITKPLKNNKLYLYSGLIGLFTVAFAWFSLRDNNPIVNDLKELNRQFGAYQVEPFSQDSDNPTIAALERSFIDSRVYRANFLDFDFLDTKKILKEVEILINFETDSDEASSASKDFDNLAIIKLRTNVEAAKIAAAYAKVLGIDYVEVNWQLDSLQPEIEQVAQTTSGEITRPRASQELVRRQAIIAVVDSGLDKNHPALQDRIVEGFDFLDGDVEVDDEVGHGTHVSGLIAKNSRAAEIMPLKVASKKTGRVSDISRAVKYAADKEVDIINLSLTLPQNSKTFEKAIEYAQAKNIIIVAAAGNQNENTCYYPSAYDNVIAVGALNKKGTDKWIHSNYGDCIDYSAIGEKVYSILPNNHYGLLSGTSQSTPQVAAKIAEIMTAKNNFDLDPDEIKAALDQVTLDLTQSKYPTSLGRKIDNDYFSVASQ